DSWDELRRADLAFFRYSATSAGIASAVGSTLPGDPEALITSGYLAFTPIVYEDFLPVSAAGIFQSAPRRAVRSRRSARYACL
ncbi:DUF1338 family protein, partial [Rhizobium leguminosarum]